MRNSPVRSSDPLLRGFGEAGLPLKAAESDDDDDGLDHRMNDAEEMMRGQWRTSIVSLSQIHKCHKNKVVTELSKPPI